MMDRYEWLDGRKLSLSVVLKIVLFVDPLQLQMSVSLLSVRSLPGQGNHHSTSYFTSSSISIFSFLFFLLLL